MSFTVTGTAHIPMEEFWTWIHNTLPEIAERDLIMDPKKVILHPMDLKLEMTAVTGETFELDAMDFWSFTEGYHPDLSPAESLKSPPRYSEDGFDLVIDFAACTHSLQGFTHPEAQAIREQWASLGESRIAPFHRKA